MLIYATKCPVWNNKMLQRFWLVTEQTTLTLSDLNVKQNNMQTTKCVKWIQFMNVTDLYIEAEE